MYFFYGSITLHYTHTQDVTKLSLVMHTRVDQCNGDVFLCYYLRKLVFVKSRSTSGLQGSVRYAVKGSAARRVHAIHAIHVFLSAGQNFFPNEVQLEA